MQVIPLFPLGVPPVPTMRVPLNIFEPRYLELVEDLMARPEAERRFGVVGLRAGHEVGEGPVSMYDVGTTVVLQSLNRFSDGTVRIVVLGVGRFRLDGLLPEAATSYLQARVFPLPHDAPAPGEDPGPAADSLRTAMQDLHDALGIPLDDFPSDPRTLSYLPLAESPLPLVDRQELLEIPGVVDRLRRAARVLRREHALFTELHAVPATEPWESGSLN